ncbi:hypothetical protein P256_02312 [Acinetobacter nectaris CIP 110549]|uniref:Uncharacterized protein n=1 Tax=Acinetobacter nectaris CIP 110549 TaxID=1392540 RepID=V2TI03_9GAMM|nr:hypothetical protein [Acinetobacter nectaris]ESK37257.1 hypothetical protein P256_02312 [Acinetobacter nectaris CIP 110549]
MKFHLIFESFKNSANGTDSFKQLKSQCELAIKDPNLELEASALLLIYSFSKNYVLLYEDQEVAPLFAEKVKAQLVGYMTEIDLALSTEDTHLILASLNSVSKQYIESSRIF